MSRQYLSFLQFLLSRIILRLNYGRISALGIIDYQYCHHQFIHFKSINSWFRSNWDNSFCFHPSQQLSHNPINIEEYWGGEIYKLTLQAEISQNSQEVEFINQNYRQKYCKLLKRWNLWTKITGINVVKSWGGEIYKPTLHSKIFQNSQEVEFINQDYRQKYCRIIKRGIL